MFSKRHVCGESVVYCIVDYVQMRFHSNRLQRVLVGATTTMSTFSFPYLFLTRQKVAAFLNRASPRPGSTSRCLANAEGYAQEKPTLF